MAGEAGGQLLGVGDEVEHAAGLKARTADQLLPVGGGKEFIDGALEAHVVRDLDVAQALHADIGGEFQHVFEKALGAGGAAGHVDGPHRLAPEGSKIGGNKQVADVNNLQGIAEIRLIGAVFEHALGIGDPLEGGGGHRLVRKGGKHVVQHVLGHAEHVLLGGEGHFEIQLVELAGGAVGPGVLVPEAGGHLEILIEARHHQQLLENLGRLGQGVKLAVELAAGDEVIPGPLGRGGGEDGGLQLKEAHLGHLAAQVGNDLRTQHDVVVNLAVAQIEEAVFQPHLLLGLGGGGDFEGQRLPHPAQDGQGRGLDLHGAGGDFIVIGFLAAFNHRAGNGDGAFPRHPVQQRLVVDHDLHHAVVIPQIQKLHPAVVADILHPAGHPHL